MISMLAVLTFSAIYLQLTAVLSCKPEYELKLGLKSKIAFMAMPTANVQISMGAKVPFETVISNEGNAYNKDTSTFTAPVDGIYFFSLTIGMPTPATAGDYFRIKIMKNNIPASYIFIGASGRWEMRTENIILPLSTGDCMNVKITTAPTEFSYIGGGIFTSHFSGFLIN